MRISYEHNFIEIIKINYAVFSTCSEVMKIGFKFESWTLYIDSTMTKQRTMKEINDTRVTCDKNYTLGPRIKLKFGALGSFLVTPYGIF